VTLYTKLDASELGRITGGMADRGQCFDAVWPWAVGGALTGSAWSGLGGAAVGGAVGGIGAYLTTPACGDGTNAPGTQLRTGVANLFKRDRR